MASFLTDEGGLRLLDRTIDYLTHTIKARLTSVTPTTASTTMNGLTAIGTDQTLGSKTIAKDGTNHRIVHDCADPVWTDAASGTITFLVVYKFVTDDNGSTPIAVADIADLAANGAQLTYTVPATATLGMFYIQL